MPDSPSAIPPKSEKKNQHFVPRNWLRRFAGQNGRVYCLQNDEVRQVAVADIMSGDWIYTVFDEWWRPSDELEDALAKIEAKADGLFVALHETQAPPTEQQWVELIEFLALTICRHPDVMARGHVRSKELAWKLADVASYADAQTFCADLKQLYSIDLPPSIYGLLRAKGLEALLEETQEIQELLPHDRKLPEQLSLKAVTLVANAVAPMNMRLLDAPVSSAFVLGDRPLPLREIAFGFDVPLSKSLAFQAWPAARDGQRILERRQAATEEVRSINQHQADRAKLVLIGSNEPLLESVKKRPDIAGP